MTKQPNSESHDLALDQHRDWRTVNARPIRRCRRRRVVQRLVILVVPAVVLGADPIGSSRLDDGGSERGSEGGPAWAISEYAPTNGFGRSRPR